ncbi:phylloplanin-like [Aristolochia californica]|uniref:phylloplanin-like n=1 Tax=Aristolochia californica TaxID=171875 RepID=UPI0035D8E1CE
MALIPSAFLLVSLAIFSTGAPSAAALLFNNDPIAAVDVRGVLYCSIDGNLPTLGLASVVSGAPVDLRCPNGSLTQVVKTVITSPTGAYIFAFNTAEVLLFDPAQCSVEVNLPLLNCDVSLPTGILRAPIRVLGLLELLLGNLLYGLVGTFVHIL